VVSLLVKSDASRRTLLARATDGSLPLHSAVRYQAPEAVVSTLLGGGEGRCVLLKPDVQGQLPLHATCRNGARLDVIDMLLGCDRGMSSTFVPPPLCLLSFFCKPIARPFGVAARDGASA
jgi:hypothetical protein